MPVFAQDVPGEVTVNEGFDDSTYESGLTISGGNSNAYIYCEEQGSYGTSGCSLAITSGTYVFEFSEDVYEVGFIVGAVNNSYDVKYYYSDNTDETIQKSGQDNSDFSTMYDSFYKSFTDYNNNEANTDKFITKFEVTLSDISVLDTLYWQYVDESTIPTTTTSTTTTTTTTSTTTTTTVPPTTTTTTVPPPPPPPPPTTTTTLYVVVNDDGSTSEYTESELKDGTVDRDQQRKDNEEEFGCYMTDAQIERGDCDIKEEPKEEIKEEPKEEIVEEEKKEEVIIVEDETKEPDTKEEFPNDDVVVPEVVVEDEVKDIEEVKEEIKEVIEEIVIEEEVVEIPEEIIIVEPEEEVKDELDKKIPGDDDIREEPIQEEDEVTDNKEPQEIIKEIEEVVVEELETEQVIEVLEEIVDVGVENLELASEDVLEVVSEVVQKSVAQEQPLTEEQTEVVAEVFNLEKKEDVAIVQEAVKNDEAVAEAVEVFVQKAIENKDVEDYTLADVVVEVQVEEFLSDPLGSFTDIQIEDIDLSAIGNDMTDDQKEKAQEVVVPVIIASQIVASVQVAPVRMRRRI